MSLEVVIVPCLSYHLRSIELRPEDIDEIIALGCSKEKALWRSYKSSIMRNAALIDGKVAAVWGVGGEVLGGIGKPWLLTSAEVYKISPLRFARIYQQEVEKMLSIFPKLVNYCDTRYSAAIRLLDITGFKIDEPAPQGMNGMLYSRFEMER